MGEQYVRLDKFIFAVRLFKSRTIAAGYCQKAKVIINDMPAKPSKMITINDKIEIKFQTIIRSYVVNGLTEKRVSAKLVSNFITETTPNDELEKLKKITQNLKYQRKKGTGRPTKKERRIIDNLINNID